MPTSFVHAFPTFALQPSQLMSDWICVIRILIAETFLLLPFLFTFSLFTFHLSPFFFRLLFGSGSSFQSPSPITTAATSMRNAACAQRLCNILVMEIELVIHKLVISRKKDYYYPNSQFPIPKSYPWRPIRRDEDRPARTTLETSQGSLVGLGHASARSLGTKQLEIKYEPSRQTPQAYSPATGTTATRTGILIGTHARNGNLQPTGAGTGRQPVMLKTQPGRKIVRRRSFAFFWTMHSDL